MLITVHHHHHLNFLCCSSALLYSLVALFLNRRHVPIMSEHQDIIVFYPINTKSDCKRVFFCGFNRNLRLCFALVNCIVCPHLIHTTLPTHTKTLRPHYSLVLTTPSCCSVHLSAQPNPPRLNIIYMYLTFFFRRWPCIP